MVASEIPRNLEVLVLAVRGLGAGGGALGDGRRKVEVTLVSSKDRRKAPSCEQASSPWADLTAAGALPTRLGPRGFRASLPVETTAEGRVFGDTQLRIRLKTSMVPAQSAALQATSKLLPVPLSRQLSAQLDEATARIEAEACLPLGAALFPLNRVLAGCDAPISGRAYGAWVPLRRVLGRLNSRAEGPSLEVWLQVHILPDHDAAVPNLQRRVKEEVAALVAAEPPPPPHPVLLGTCLPQQDPVHHCWEQGLPLRQPSRVRRQTARLPRRASSRPSTAGTTPATTPPATPTPSAATASPTSTTPSPTAATPSPPATPSPLATKPSASAAPFPFPFAKQLPLALAAPFPVATPFPVGLPSPLATTPSATMTLATPFVAPTTPPPLDDRANSASEWSSDKGSERSRWAEESISMKISTTEKVPKKIEAPNLRPAAGRELRRCRARSQGGPGPRIAAGIRRVATVAPPAKAFVTDVARGGLGSFTSGQDTGGGDAGGGHRVRGVPATEGCADNIPVSIVLKKRVCQHRA